MILRVFLFLIFWCWALTLSAQDLAADLDKRIGLAFDNPEIAPETALVEINEVLQEAKKSGLLRQEASARSVKGHLLCLSGQYAAGFKEFKQAQTIRQQTGDQIGVATIYRNMAEYDYDLGNISESLASIRSAIQINQQICEQVPGSPKADSAEINLAMDFVFQSTVLDLEDSKLEAVAVARKAYDICYKFDNPQNRALAALTLGNRYYGVAQGDGDEQTRKNNLDSALYFYQQARLLYQPNPVNLAKCLLNIGAVEADLGHYDAAMQMFKQCKEVNTLLLNDQDVWIATIQIARCLQLQEKYSEAMPAIQEALNTPHDEFPLDWQVKLYEYLTDQYEAIDSTAVALKYLRQATELKGSLIGVDWVRKSAFLQKDLEKTNAQREALKAEKNQLIATGLGIIGVLLLLTLYLTYRFLRERAVKNLLIGKNVGREAALKTIADHLHTNVQLELNTTANNLKQLAAERPELKEALNKVEQATAIVRNISHDYNITMLKHASITEFLEAFFESKQEQHPDIQIDFSSTVTRELDLEMKTGLYRMVLDLFLNSVRHAHPKHIQVLMSETDHSIKLTYSDDGPGFDFEKKLKESNGIGLKEIVEKTALWGGTMKGPAPGASESRYQFEFPIKRAS